jgi:hypothetical protein
MGPSAHDPTIAAQRLKCELRGELQLAHHRSAAAEDGVVHVGDHASAAAVDASRVRYAKRHVIENIEHLELKLGLHPLRDVKVPE